jgi:mRNA interferase MazF
MFEQGDIVSVAFPFTNASTFKKRPALILSNHKVNQTGDYLLVQITSKVKNDGLTMNLNDSDFIIKVLPLKSYVRIHKIFLLNESLIINKITRVSDKFRKHLNKRITELIN